METVNVNSVGERFISVNGLEWEVKKLEGAVAFCSKVVDGKAKKGRPSKFLVYGRTEDTLNLEPEFPTTDVVIDEVNF
jgi:hypothetical protein